MNTTRLRFRSRSLPHVGVILAACTLSSCTRPPPAPKAPSAIEKVRGEQYDADLTKALKARRSALGSDYVPRTKHVLKDGSPKYTNRLLQQTSPYLLQHAHNPVNWFPWGDDAFARAKALGRPVLLSVGYSTCHWCHVMEEESFEDEEIAAYINAHYVAIKVDREERPDVDAVYMEAVRLLTKRGGWPMTVWLTQDRKPFYGGTYFPARDGDRGTRKGFLTLLGELSDEFQKSPTDVSARAEQIAAQVGGGLERTAVLGETPDAAVLDHAFTQIASRYDAKNGGVQQQHKFPSSLPLRFLLRHARRTQSAEALHMATFTLEKMARGGMYDQVGGGFHRYSTDQVWLVPHFEKMLYDNALLVPAYLEASLLTASPAQKTLFVRIAREVLDYAAREMRTKWGAFYSATDADAMAPSGHREEGYNFTWTPAEMKPLLTDAEWTLCARHWDVGAMGNFEHRNVLHVAVPLADIAAERNTSVVSLRAIVDGAKKKLYAARAKRPQPLLDDKVLASWNGLMISAFAAGARLDGSKRYGDIALKALDDVRERLFVGGRLLRTARGRDAHLMAYAEDYAFLIAAGIDVFEATGDVESLEFAFALDAVLQSHYEDPAGGLFVTAKDAETLLAKERSKTDNAVPSANSIHAMNMYRLAALTGDAAYLKRGDNAVRSVGAYLKRSPSAVSELLLAVDFRLGDAKEVVIVVPETRVDAFPLLNVFREVFVPHHVLSVHSSYDQAPVKVAQGKTARGETATAYVCRQGVCELPTTDGAKFRALLLQ